MTSVLPYPPKRILIIKPSAIGDVVHALPILELLKSHWPGAEVDWVVTPACAGLLEGHPLLSKVHLFQRRKLGSWWRNPKTLTGLFAFTRELRDRRYDVVIDLQGLFRSGWIAWNTGAPVRIGFANAREGAPIFYSHEVDVGTTEQHALDRYLKVIEALGCPTSPVEFRFYPSDSDQRIVQELLAPLAAAPFAVLLPGTNWETKRWPVEHFADLARRIRTEHGFKIVAAGGPGDAEMGQQIGADLNLAGKTTLKQLVVLLERSQLVIANDSGPMHIASALNKPLVTLFGPTNPVRTGPYGRADTVIRLDLPCSPCYSRRCSHRSCLAQLEPSRVQQFVHLSLGRA